MSEARRIDFVVSRFPCRSEQFVMRDVLGLVRRGLEVRIFAVGDREGDTVEVPAELKTLAVWRRPSWFHLQLWLLALRGFLSRPFTGLRVVGQALVIGSRERALGRTLRMAVLALSLPDDRRTARVHGHFANHPASFALLYATAIRVEFSFAAHAHDLWALPLDLATKSRHARAILTCSEPAASDLRDRLDETQRAKVVVTRHGVELRPRPERKRSPSGEISFSVIAVGRLEAKKGFLNLLEAIARLAHKNIPVVCEIIGEGPERANLVAAITRLELRADVRLTGWLTGGELDLRYHRAQALIAPSVVTADGDRDNLPNVVLEAMAAGVPVIASALPAMVELNRDRESLLVVEPGSVDQLAAAIANLIANPDLAETVSLNGQATVAARFDLAHTSLALAAALSASTKTPDR